MHSRVERASSIPPLAVFETRSAGFLADPRLDPAIAAYCREMIAPDPGDWPMLKLFNQLNRYMVSFLLIHHHQAWRHHGGPLPTLRLLQSSSSLSPRQTTSIVAGLRAGSLLVPEAIEGQRARILAPAPLLSAAIARSMLAFLRAADMIEAPTPPRAPLFDADPELQNELIHRSAAYVFAQGNLLDPHPWVQHFTTKDCGYLVLTAVIGAALAPPGAAASLSYRDLARRFYVSRSHIGNLMAHAARELWFTTDGKGGLTWIDERVLRDFRAWAAAEAAHYAVLADAILAERADTPLP